MNLISMQIILQNWNRMNHKKKSVLMHKITNGLALWRFDHPSSYNSHPTRQRVNSICHPRSLQVINGPTLTLSVCLSVCLPPSGQAHIKQHHENKDIPRFISFLSGVQFFPLRLPIHCLWALYPQSEKLA